MEERSGAGARSWTDDLNYSRPLLIHNYIVKYLLEYLYTVFVLVVILYRLMLFVYLFACLWLFIQMNLFRIVLKFLIWSIKFIRKQHITNDLFSVNEVVFSHIFVLTWLSYKLNNIFRINMNITIDRETEGQTKTKRGCV